MKTWSVSSRRPLGTLLAVVLCAALALSISATGAAGKGGKCAKGAEAPGCTLPEGTRFYKGLGDSAAITVEVGPKGVALTAYARPTDIRATEQAGFDLHLGKPLDPQALIDAIASLVKR